MDKLNGLRVAGALLSLAGLVSCGGSEDEKVLKEPVTAETAASGPAPATPTVELQPAADAAPMAVPEIPALPQEDPCVSFGEYGSPPIALVEGGVVVTRFARECVTRAGRRGFLRESPWTAMGFPCSGGQGRIEVRGHYWSPRMVSLVMSTDCKMKLEKAEEVAQLGRSTLHLAPEARFLAYNPFAVQYWEIPGLEDADVGFSVDLRSPEAKQRVWREFLEKKPLPVRLYGRENAWIRGDHFFAVEGALHLTATHSFRLDLVNIVALGPDELNEVHGRCKALRPARNCQAVFGPR